MSTYALRLENSTDTAARVRMAELTGFTPGATPLTVRGGLRPDGGGVVTVNAGAMTVNVAPFLALVPGGVSTVQAAYPFVHDAAATLTIAAGHATLARVDTIVARVRENAFDASGSTDAAVVVVQGTPGSGAPTLPTNSIPLRDINVPAGLSVGTGGLSSGNLSTDRRVYLQGLSSANEVAQRRSIGADMTYSATGYAVLSNGSERTALTRAFTKHSADTKLMLDVRAVVRNSAGSADTISVGLRINGADSDVGVTWAIPTAAGQVVTGVAEVTGVAAGTFNIEPVVKTGGSATAVLDSGRSFISYTVREVPA